jgi:hypothetical protein
MSRVIGAADSILVSQFGAQVAHYWRIIQRRIAQRQTYSKAKAKPIAMIRTRKALGGGSILPRASSSQELWGALDYQNL